MKQQTNTKKKPTIYFATTEKPPLDWFYYVVSENCDEVHGKDLDAVLRMAVSKFDKIINFGIGS